MVAKLAAHRKELLDIVDTHDDAWFAERAKEGDRTRKGMLKHLAEAEHSYIEVWAKRARDEDNPNLGNRGSIGTAPLLDEALKLSLAELRQRLDEQRVRTLQFIAETGDGEMERPIHGTPFGTLTVKQCVKSMYRHDRMHIEEMLGKPQSYDIRTRDGTKV
ncbi:MAG: DinB family protein [Candidatus Sericytochromatia bacterium]|uniref:DinB family protein n=1 Tax=Candidatus Tanganyikabacteria bacterium TaxID=2961651 RepID=A0A937X8L7_9BACT|nr:DinB family protein [Candidatus Tanganyikabacteria bacterium]